MKKEKYFSCLLGLFLSIGLCKPVNAQQSLEDRITELQEQIDILRSQVEETSEIAETAIESAESTVRTNQSLGGVTLGGYGELHYNNLSSGKEVDFHRFVLFFGNEFTENLHFFSELELEHSLAGDGKEGEVELEQAYIQYDLNTNLSTRAGLFLLPVGLLNETHEPPTFFGVERNGIETEIIPATWWEAGAALSGRIDNSVSYDFAVHSGLALPTTGSNAYRIRSGRQKVSEASAEDMAFTGRIRYTGMPGLELAMSLQYQENITQGVDPDASARLLEAHLSYQSGPFGLKALYAEWDIDGPAAKVLGRDSQYGYFVEPSYAFNPQWAVFVRYGEYNTFDGLPAAAAVKQRSAGLNWNLHEDVVLKADYIEFNGASDDHGFNLGLGYQF